MGDVRAYDMSRFQRIISTDGGRIRGSFRALTTGKHGDEVLIWPIEVTVEFDGGTWGQMLYSHDMTATVRGQEVDIPKHMIAERKLATIEDAWDDMTAALLAVATVARETMLTESKDPS